MNNKATYMRRIFSCIMMMLALAWLTVSTPFVYAGQQQVAAQKAKAGSSTNQDSNPFSNTTEEKTESGNPTLSEYLHDVHEHLQYTPAPEQYNKCHPFDTYYAFHPELISPPPEA